MSETRKGSARVLAPPLLQLLQQVVDLAGILRVRDPLEQALAGAAHDHAVVRHQADGRDHAGRPVELVAELTPQDGDGDAD